MKMTLKRTLVMGLMAVLIVIAVIPAQVAFAAPAKMKLKDFYYYLPDGSEWSFMEVEDEGPRMQKMGEGCKTYRGIKIGDKASKVISKYGKTTKKKFNNNDSYNKFLKSYKEYYGFTTTGWKYYLEYTYKAGTKNSRTLRFYLDKNNKVIDVVYIHRIKYFKLNSKSVDIDLKFKAPKGKKITTKKISGKKVQILPKGTTLRYNDNKIEKDFLGYNTGIMIDISQINNKGKVVAIPSMYMPIFIGRIDNGVNLGDFLSQEMIKVNPKTGAYVSALDANKLGKYKYFKMTIYDNNWENGFDKPVNRYFKY